LNGTSKPRDFLKNCDAKSWFKCDTCTHSFEGTLKHVTKGVWCPYCSKPPKKLCKDADCQMCKNNSLASQPGAKHWHPTKNHPITPRDVIKGSSTKYWFKCETCFHDYENIVYALRGDALGCPYCSNQMRCKDSNCRACFYNSFASNPNSIHWHPTKNDSVKPRDIAKRSHDEYWFKCRDCCHELKKKVMNINVVQSDEEGWGCSYCSKTHRKFCDNIECQFCYENSFASCEKSKYWHPTKNGSLKPRDVSRKNDIKAWFTCDSCSHDFDATIGHINDGAWCPYCSKPPKKLCKDADCQMCKNNSFASQSRSKNWHMTKNGSVTPRDVARGSNKKYWFTCDECQHDFEMSLGNISCSNQWCPYCHSSKLCCSSDCEFCFKKSFASHPKAKHWHPTKNESLVPRDICMSSNMKVWFNCDVCLNSFVAYIRHVSGRNGWCSICKNKTEKKMYESLINYYPEIKMQFRANWSKNPQTDCYYPFDFCIEEKQTIIELDGRQHFEDIKFWKSSYGKIHTDDLFKQTAANNNGYKVIRILQIDVWSDKYDWLSELIESIENNTIQNIFICKNNEYNSFEKYFSNIQQRVPEPRQGL